MYGVDFFYARGLSFFAFCLKKNRKYGKFTLDFVLSENSTAFYDFEVSHDQKLTSCTRSLKIVENNVVPRAFSFDPLRREEALGTGSKN